MSSIFWNNFLPGALCPVLVCPLLNQSWERERQSESHSDRRSDRQTETNRKKHFPLCCVRPIRSRLLELDWHVFIDATLQAAKAFSPFTRSSWQLIQVSCLLLLIYCLLLFLLLFFCLGIIDSSLHLSVLSGLNCKHCYFILFSQLVESEIVYTE